MYVLIELQRFSEVLEGAIEMKKYPRPVNMPWLLPYILSVRIRGLSTLWDAFKVGPEILSIF